MPIPNMLGMLLPSFEATNLKNSLTSNCDAIGDVLLPQYQNMQELVGTVEGKKFHSKAVQNLNDALVKYLRETKLEHKALRDPSVLEYIIAAMENTLALRPFLEQCIARDVGKTVVTASMTFNKQTLLQLLDLLDFFAVYSATLINYISAEELASVQGSNVKVEGVGPNDLTYLNARVVTFGIALRVLATPANKLKSDYAEIPEAVFSEETYNELVNAFGAKVTDPLGLSAVPFPLSILYRVKLSWAEHQMDKYDECVEAARATELRILLYKKQLAEKNGDAALEKLIEKHEKRLMDLKYKRERLEKKYGLE